MKVFHLLALLYVVFAQLGVVWLVFNFSEALVVGAQIATAGSLYAFRYPGRQLLLTRIAMRLSML